MMTRKDYVATAEILSNYTQHFDVGTFADIVNDFADMFENDNPRFDHDRFVEACMKIGANN
jgi:hypothetical protein